MELPVELQKKIIEFLVSLPSMGDNDSQRAFIYHAGLDQQLQDQISFDKPPIQFVPILVSKLLKYGKLTGGQHALEAVLETAKNYIGKDKKTYCETLLQELRTKAKEQSQISPAPEDTESLTNELFAGALESLKSGDEDAIQKLHKMLHVRGIGLSSKKITVGDDISGSTAVAFGSDIRIIINQHVLPENILGALRVVADALDRRAQDAFTDTHHIRVFLASPGDVSDERQLALKVMQRLQKDPIYKEHITIELVTWDLPDSNTPVLVSIDPYEAINQGRISPSHCDIVVIIMWSQMGIPLNPRHIKPKEFQFNAPTKLGRDRYFSCTEWAYIDAIQTNYQQGFPLIAVYRCVEEPKYGANDPKKYEKMQQYDLVDAFFSSFRNPKGSFQQNYNVYRSPSEFEELFDLHLRKLIACVIENRIPKPLSEINDSNSIKLVSPIEWPKDKSPFTGLRAFGPEDAPIFFGRGKETDELIKHFTNPSSRFLAVVGASGSGKSSLVGAGLIPRLAANALSNLGSKDWITIRFTPGEFESGDPLDALVVAMKEGLPELKKWAYRELTSKLRQNPIEIDDICREGLVERPNWTQVLLFIDQFEELFTLVKPEHIETFIILLEAIVKSKYFRAVITLRADFYHQCVEHPTLSGLLKENSTYPLAAPGLSALYEMITQPALVAGLEYEQDLAETILVHTGENPGALPLMAYALDELYKSREESIKLTWDAYERFGGVKGAIGTRAEQIFESLDVEAQATLSDVFLHLVKVDERGITTRQRARLSVVAPTDAPARLISTLTDTRLLVQSSGEDHHPVVEVAHEALFYSWPRLANWIGKTRDDLGLLNLVQQAAQLWKANDYNTTFLWPDERLQPVYGMIERLQPELDETVQDFIRSEAERLLEELDDIDLSHQRRCFIGERLAEIGDPRHGVGIRPDGLPQIEWCFVPSGEVRTEEGKYISVQSFYIAKYPITFSQFQAFLDDPEGYECEDWWKDADLWKRHNSGRSSPENEQRFKYANHPRDNVDWFHAVAFCHWLTAKLPPDGRPIAEMGTDWLIRLPNEWEWMQAATGGDYKNLYPWGLEWENGRTNTNESGLSRTTAVGMYPHGISSTEALDMCGNVWEWCLNEFKKPYTQMKHCVLKGGSWINNKDLARVISRIGHEAIFSQDTTGFRICCGPLVSGK